MHHSSEGNWCGPVSSRLSHWGELSLRDRGNQPTHSHIKHISSTSVLSRHQHTSQNRQQTILQIGSRVAALRNGKIKRGLLVGMQGARLSLGFDRALFSPGSRGGDGLGHSHTDTSRAGFIFGKIPRSSSRFDTTCTAVAAAAEMLFCPTRTIDTAVACAASLVDVEGGSIASCKRQPFLVLNNPKHG